MQVFRSHRRLMLAVIVAFVVFEVAAVGLLAAAFAFDLVGIAHFSRLMDGGPETVELLRWGAFLDLGGYLAFGIIVLYLAEQLWTSNPPAVMALSTAGAGAVLDDQLGLLRCRGVTLDIDIPQPRASEDSGHD